MRRYIDSLDVGGLVGYFRETIYGNGAPSAEIDAFPGQRYFDVVSQEEWVCVLRSEAGVTWQDRSGKLDKSGGTMTGALVAQANTNYTTRQVRNIILVAEGAELPAGSNGDICLVYTP